MVRDKCKTILNGTGQPDKIRASSPLETDPKNVVFVNQHRTAAANFTYRNRHPAPCSTRADDEAATKVVKKRKFPRGGYRRDVCAVTVILWFFARCTPLLFQTYARSVLSYAGPFWAPMISPSSRKSLEAVQNIGLRTILGSPYYVSNRDTLDSTNRLTIQEFIEKKLPKLLLP